MTNGAEVPMEPCPGRGEGAKGKGREMGIKQHQRAKGEN